MQKGVCRPNGRYSRQSIPPLPEKSPGVRRAYARQAPVVQTIRYRISASRASERRMMKRPSAFEAMSSRACVFPPIHFL